MGKSVISDTHVIKRGDGWAVFKEGSTRASRVYDLKKDAVKNATEYAKQGGDLIIHTEDGMVQAWRSYKKPA